MTTWAQVKAAIAATILPLTVWLDDSIAGCAVPAGDGVTDLKKLVTFAAVNPLGSELDIADGSTLQDPTYLQDVTLSFAPVTTVGLAFTGTNPSLALRGISSLIRTTNNAQPVCVVNGQSLELAWTGFTFRDVDNNTIGNSLTGQPVFQIAAGASLSVTTVGNFVYSDGSISGAASSTLVILYDTDLKQLPNLPAMLGTVLADGIESPIGIPIVNAVTNATSPYTARPGEIVTVDPTAGDVVINLPKIAGPRDGSQVIVKCIALSANTVTVQPTATLPATTIDGAANDVLAPTTTKISRVYAIDLHRNDWIIAATYG